MDYSWVPYITIIIINTIITTNSLCLDGSNIWTMIIMIIAVQHLLISLLLRFFLVVVATAVVFVVVVVDDYDDGDVVDGGDDDDGDDVAVLQLGCTDSSFLIEELGTAI